MWHRLLTELQQGNTKAIARTISLVENEAPGHENFLENLNYDQHAHLIGITGPPGAGKSTIVDLLIGHFVNQNKKIAVLCVDPSSPFHLGALLGDRIRMSTWYNHPAVFIRSLATRGSLGGLHPRIIEITDILRTAGFDKIIIETVGVGQSEIEIAGLADTTVVILVPEAGDEIQTMKAGLMEIADIFVVNKADRPDADTFASNLRKMLLSSNLTPSEAIPIIKTTASQNDGIDDLAGSIDLHGSLQQKNKRKIYLLTEKAWHLLRNKRMQNFSKHKLKEILEEIMEKGNVNVYKLVASL